MQSKSPSVSIPQYNPPTPMNFNTPYGNLTYGNGAYNFNPSNAVQQQTGNIQNMQNQIMSQFGVTPQQQLSNQSDWQKAFMQAATQNTLPSLYNTLYNQGLGGSSVYGSSMANLLSNLGTQSVLNSQNLNLANQQNLQGLYAQLQGTNNANMQYGLGLSQLGGQYNLGQNQQAQQIYGMQLPYQYAQNYQNAVNSMNQSIPWLQPALTAAGAIGGSYFGNPMMGAQIGAGLGGAINGGMGGQNNNAYMGLASLLPSQMNTGGMPSMSPQILQGYGGGVSNLWNQNGGASQAMATSPNLSLFNPQMITGGS